MVGVVEPWAVNGWGLNAVTLTGVHVGAVLYVAVRVTAELGRVIWVWASKGVTAPLPKTEVSPVQRSKTWPAAGVAAKISTRVPPG